jgi:hypothetical protein
MRFASRGAALLGVVLLGCQSFPELHFASECTTGGACDASIQTDASAVRDSGAGDSDSVDAVADASSLPCGPLSCDLTTMTCCEAPQGFECVFKGTGCAGVDIQCHAAADCGNNKVCCAISGDGGALKRVLCMGPQPCAKAGGDVLCDPDGSVLCAGDASCSPTSVRGYSACE